MNERQQKRKSAFDAKQAEATRLVRAKEAAEACLKSEETSFGEKTRARIILKRLRKGQNIH